MQFKQEGNFYNCGTHYVEDNQTSLMASEIAAQIEKEVHIPAKLKSL